MEKQSKNWGVFIGPKGTHKKNTRKTKTNKFKTTKILQKGFFFKMRENKQRPKNFLFPAPERKPGFWFLVEGVFFPLNFLPLSKTTEPNQTRPKNKQNREGKGAGEKKKKKGKERKKRIFFAGGRNKMKKKKKFFREPPPPPTHPPFHPPPHPPPPCPRGNLLFPSRPQKNTFLGPIPEIKNFVRGHPPPPPPPRFFFSFCPFPGANKKKYKNPILGKNP